MTIALVLTALLALPLALVLVRFSAKRNQVQPVDLDLDVEQRFIAALLADPCQWLRVEEVLPAEAFLDEAARSAYQELSFIATTSGLSAYSYRGPDEQAVDIALTAALADEKIQTALTEPLRHLTAAYEAASSRFVALEDPTKLLDLGSTVLGHHESRAQNTPRSPFVFDAAQKTMRRLYVAPTRRRYVATAIAAMVAASIGTLSVFHALSSPAARVVGLAALLTLLATSIEVALVDLDTFYLDTPFFYATGALGWALSITANLLNHSPSHLISGVVTALGVAATFEFLARAFAALRGVTQGAGDTWIVLATVGIPAGLVGSWQVGLYSLLAGSVSTILGWLYLRARGRATAATPLAFGPYLATGWVLALTWFICLH